MNTAREAWRLVRDVIFALAGLYLLKRVADGAVPRDVAPMMLAIAAGLCGLPVFLRRDEQSRNGNEK